MRKLIASINMTPDGFCDHTAMIVDTSYAFKQLFWVRVTLISIKNRINLRLLKTRNLGSGITVCLPLHIYLF
jgi:hypothetical protein